MDIKFSYITPDNWKIFNSLKVKDEQKNFVPSNLVILARAFAYREQNSKVYAIYNNDNQPVGILMQHDYEENDKLLCVLNEFMISEQHQRKGYGKAALQLWISKIKNENRYDSIILSYITGNQDACNIYLKMGFKHTGEIDEDEVLMKYTLKNNE